MEPGPAIVAVALGSLLALGILTLVFLWRSGRLAARRKVCREGRSASRRLTFQSPGDAPRTFQQSGLVVSHAGTALLVAWVALPAIGFVLVVVGTALSYFPGFYVPVFGSWDGLMTPWLVVFILTHLLAAVVITFYSTMRMWCMLPASRMSESTHIMIQEEVPCLDEGALPGPEGEDAQPGLFRGLQARAAALQRSLARVSERTLLPVRLQGGARQVEYTCIRYTFDEAEDRFRPTGTSMPTVSEAHEVLRNGGLAEAKVAETRAMCGANDIHVHVPSIPGALLEEFMNVIYVFQSIGTWSYNAVSSWNIGIVWLAMMLTSGTYRSLFVSRRSKKKIAELAKLQAPCAVLRGGEWVTLCSSEVVLGDIVRVEDGTSPVPCDGTLLQGSLIVDESMLTGEPMPVQKAAVADSQHEAVGKRSVVHAGTLVLQSAGPAGGKAVIIATAVGALTTRGQLIRMVLFPSSVRFKYNDQLPLVYFIMSCYCVLLALCYIFFTRTGSPVMTVLMMFTKMAMCLSPMLPVSMVMGQMAAARRLNGEHKIKCLQPGRIPIAGKISTMVFDKTGTITKDGMDLAYLVCAEAGGFGPRLAPGASGPGEGSGAQERGAGSEMQRALACCHTVACMEDGSLVGNQVEVAMVRAAGWKLEQGGIVRSPSGEDTLEIVRPLDFDHHRTTSGAVVRCPTGSLTVYMKGSCERIRELLAPGEAPPGYEDAAQRCARENYYTLAVAAKALPASMTPEQLQDVPRDELEAGLRCCGLLLFRNEMKADSPEAMRLLKAGSVRCLMCTGDNALTGVAIGRQCGILDSDRLLLGDVDAASGELFWTDPEGAKGGACREDLGAHEGPLAVTKAAWRQLCTGSPTQLEGIWDRIVVFARMKPEDKVSVVKFLQAHGLVVGMCGDGGNDCGALRVAHAGLALSEAEASLVSPFCTSRDEKTLLTVVDLLREGRACLATNLATFQYFIVYAFIVTLSGVSGTMMGNWGGAEYVWIVMDLLVSVLMVSTMTHSRPSLVLASHRPTASLVGCRTIAAIAFPVCTFVLAQVAAFGLLWSHSWYEFVDPVNGLHVAPKDWPKFGDNYDSATITCCRVVALITAAFTATYGGSFRRCVARNLGISALYVLLLGGIYLLCFTRPTVFSCIFRVNCDTASSLAARSVPVLSQYSAGGTGGCFMGPQLRLWQEAAAALASNTTGGDVWTPQVDQGCLPDEQVLQLLPYDDPAISTMGCSGPNNCWSLDFKFQMAAVLTVYVVANHLFAQCVLLGPAAAWLRRRQGPKGP